MPRTDVVQPTDAVPTGDAVPPTDGLPPKTLGGAPSDPQPPISLTAVGALAGVAGALLPAIGLSMRYLAFAFDSRISIVRGAAAAAAPIPALAELGFLALIAPLLIFILVLAVDYFASKETLYGAINIVSTIVAGLFVIFASGFTQFWNWKLLLGAVILITTGNATQIFFLMLKRTDEPLGLKRAWPVAIPALIAAVLIGGLYFVRLPAGEITFGHDSGVPNGLYAVVGSSGDEMYLLPCKDHRRLVAADEGIVDSIRFLPANTAPWAAHLGVSSDCPERRTGR